MAQLLTDELWDAVRPLLPPHRPRPRGGRPPVDDRVALAGILFVLKTGIGWEDLPREIGCSGMTCWRGLRDWQAAGVWDALHRLLLDRLRGAERIDFSRACWSTAAPCGPFWGATDRPEPDGPPQARQQTSRCGHG